MSTHTEHACTWIRGAKSPRTSLLSHQRDVGSGGGCGDGLGGRGGVHGLDVGLERERRLERVGRLLQALERAEGCLHASQQLVLLCRDHIRAGALAQLLPYPGQTRDQSVLTILC